MLKRYYKIDEAAVFLSEESNHKLGQRDILELAAREEIRLCSWYDGPISAFKNCTPFDEPEIVGPSYTFRGYIQIPTSSIDFDGYILLFDSLHMIEEFESSDMSPPEDGMHENFFWGKYNCEPERGCFHVPFEFFIEEIVVPTVDLLSLTREVVVEHGEENLNKLFGRRQLQYEIILAVISALNFDPRAIPDGGKAKIKAACLTRTRLFTPEGFDHAWKLGTSLFRMANHDKFSPK